MRIMLRKSVADEICRYWGLPLVRKSAVKTRRQEFLEIKRELLAHIRKLRKQEEASLKKASWELEQSVALEKAAGKKTREKADNGTIRTWGNGKKYKRIAPGKWVQVFNDDRTRGAKQSLRYIEKKIASINDELELMKFVQNNKEKFVDNWGYPLPAVERLSELAHKRNEEIHTWSQDNKAIAEDIIKRENFKNKLANMTTKVNKLLSEKHSRKEFEEFQKTNTKPLLQEIKDVMDTFPHDSNGYNKIRWIYSRVNTLDEKISAKEWNAYKKEYKEEEESKKTKEQLQAEQEEAERQKIEYEKERVKRREGWKFARDYENLTVPRQKNVLRLSSNEYLSDLIESYNVLMDRIHKMHDNLEAREDYVQDRNKKLLNLTTTSLRMWNEQLAIKKVLNSRNEEAKKTALERDKIGNNLSNAKNRVTFLEEMSDDISKEVGFETWSKLFTKDEMSDLLSTNRDKKKVSNILSGKRPFTSINADRAKLLRLLDRERANLTELEKA